MSRKKYRTLLNSYLAGRVSLPAFYEGAAELGVEAAEAEADLIRAKEQAARGDQAAKADAAEKMPPSRCQIAETISNGAANN